jgi:two-component system, chemotaxis family, protein-glutamate methylesterase/glutaminase
MIKVLIVEDSDVVSFLLAAILSNESDFEVVGRAKNGLEAVKLNHELLPDVITMDIRMPVMDGFEATRMIMATNPVPIVVISSSVDNEELKITFRAIEEGALAVLEKPVGFSHPRFETNRGELVDTVRAMAEVKVIRRRFTEKTVIDLLESAIKQEKRVYEVVAIGCSTGGPQALKILIGSLPMGFPLPILIAQHMSDGFIAGLAGWLNSNTLLTVTVAEDHQALKPGTVYIAPDNYHLLVERSHNGLITLLSQEDDYINGFRPSATPLLKSVAQVCKGQGIGILLTGMGVDGADGLLTMRKAGSHTLVQDSDSAVVYGMPGAAIALGAVDQVVQLDKMASYLLTLARQ